MSRDCPLDCKVYVGDLPTHVTDRDLEPTFRHYGPLVKVWVARNPPGFAFVEFEDPRDADDAIKDLDGTKICGAIVRVEQCSGKTRPKPWDRRPPPRGSRGRGYNPDDRCYACGERGHYAYDCREQARGVGRRRSRSRSYERSSRRRRSRSRSRGRSYSRSPRRRSPSPRRRSRDSNRRSESPSRRSDRGRNGNRSYSRSPRRSKSRSRSGSAHRSPRDY